MVVLCERRVPYHECRGALTPNLDKPGSIETCSDNRTQEGINNDMHVLVCVYASRYCRVRSIRKRDRKPIVGVALLKAPPLRLMQYPGKYCGL